MIALYKDPNGETIFSLSGPPFTTAGDLPDAKTVALEQKVKELETQLKVQMPLLISYKTDLLYVCVSSLKSETFRKLHNFAISLTV